MAEFCMTVCMSMSFSVKTNENHPKQNCCPSAVSWTTFQTESCKATGFHTDRHRHFSIRGVGGACGSDRRGLVLRPDNQCPLGGVTTKASDQLLVSFFLGQGKEKKASSCLLPGLLRPSTSQAATQGGEACPRDESRSF